MMYRMAAPDPVYDTEAHRLDMMARDIDAAVSRALHAEMVARETAAEIVAAYIGRWNLASRCEWFVSEDGGSLGGSLGWSRRVSLYVDRREVWRCRWVEAPTHVYTLSARWLETPWSCVARLRA